MRVEPAVTNGMTTNSVEEIVQMYASLDPNLGKLIQFKEYYDSKLMENRKKHHVDEDLQKKVNKVKLPCFDGSGEETTRSWVQKLDTYLSYSPMIEKGVVKFAILHLRGSAHKWWHYGQVSLGLKTITSYNEFTQRLMSRFDLRDPE